MKGGNYTGPRLVHRWPQLVARWPLQRLPPVLLALLVGLHLLLAWVFHTDRDFFPSPMPHMGYAYVVDQVRAMEGYRPLQPPRIMYPGFKAVFDGERGQGLHLSEPRALMTELGRGRLRGLWRNRDPISYNNEIPLPFFLPALAHALSGGSVTAVALTPQVFLAILLLSVYGIGRQAGGPWVGLAAASIASGYPGLFQLSHTLHDSLAVGALVTAVVYLLMRGRGFSCPGWCALAGTLAFVAARSSENISGIMLIGLIVSGPLLMEIISLVRQRRSAPPQLWKRLAGVVLFFAPLVLFNWGRLITFLTRIHQSRTTHEGDAIIGSHVPDFLSGLIAHCAYLFQIAFDLLQPMMTLWLIAGAVLLWRAPRGHRLAVLLMAAIPLVLLSFMPKKAIWYITPFLPALALITAMGLGGLKSAILRQWALGLSSASGVAMLLFSSLASPQLQQQLDLDRISPAIKQTAVVIGLNGPTLGWHRGRKNVQGIAAAARQLAAHDRQKALTGAGPRRVAVFGRETQQVEGFRYLLELSRPDCMVFDPLHPFMQPEARRRLERLTFHYLVFLDWDRPSPRPTDCRGLMRARTDWHPRLQASNPGGPLRRLVQRLLESGWIRVDLPSGPIYEASGKDRLVLLEDHR